jgi:hypothetical protein
MPGGYLKHPANSEGFKHTKKKKIERGESHTMYMALTFALKKSILRQKEEL